MKKNLGKMRELNGNMSKMAEAGIEGMEALQEKSKAVTEAWVKSLVMHEKDVLNKVYEQVIIIFASPFSLFFSAYGRAQIRKSVPPFCAVDCALCPRAVKGNRYPPLQLCMRNEDARKTQKQKNK